MKSQDQHIKDGTFRPNRHQHKGAKTRLETAPPPPAKMPKAAHAIWREIVAEIFETSALSLKDLGALSILVLHEWYCVTARADLEKNGLVIIAELKAGPKATQNPAWRVLQDATRVVVHLRQQFGLTPMSGQRMSLPDPIKKYDPLDALEN